MIDAPIPYLERIRTYYERSATARPTSGRTTPTCRSSRWRSRSPQCRVALVTTAAPYQPDKGDQGPGAPYNAAAKFYDVYSGDTARDHDLRISHVGDRPRAHDGARTRARYFPLAELRRAAARGPHRLGRAALPRPADQPQPSHDARGRLPGAASPAAAPTASTRRSWSPTARSATSASASPRATLEEQRHRDRRHGLREGHRRARRRAAASVLRLPARQCRRAGRTTRPRRRSRSSSRWRCSRRHRPRARRCSRRCAGATSADWKLDYSNVERLTPEEIARGAPRSTSSGRSRAPCASRAERPEMTP